ncbi:MAG TPA: Kdo hydroxylase family protein [Acetobacteraceae bacterium]|nr:Kdo hydroxylase family protein [Acetobacteraceae bacterium]
MSDPARLQPEDVLETLPVAAWHGPFAPELRDRAIRALEGGKVLFLPDLGFQAAPEEAVFLTGTAAGGARKNVSLDPETGKASNIGLPPDEAGRLAAMIDRFGRQALRLACDLLPGYAPALARARTSFRPTEIAGRAYSTRHDDRLLHVDAFPTRPMHGKRILRLFANVAPDGAPRAWRVGEAFEDFARAFAPRVRPPLPASAWLMHRLGLTKARRSAYDHWMLRLHDVGKFDADWQARAPRADIAFPAGSTWLCFTDQVLHAALSGHCAMEQTFYLPVDAMRTPARAPLRVLEGVMGQRLV